MVNENKLAEIINGRPRLETPRLLLREIGFEDQQDIFEYASDEGTTRYLCWEHHTSPDETGTFIEQQLRSQFETHESIGFGIVYKADRKLIGMCSLSDFCFEHQFCEMGYVLSVPYRKRRIMTEAVRAVLLFGFHTLRLHRIEARTRVKNFPSQIVLKNVGMHYEGLLRERALVKGEHTDFKLYSILAGEFEYLD